MCLWTRDRGESFDSVGDDESEGLSEHSDANKTTTETRTRGMMKGDDGTRTYMLEFRGWWRWMQFKIP